MRSHEIWGRGPALPGRDQLFVPASVDVGSEGHQAMLRAVEAEHPWPEGGKGRKAFEDRFRNLLDMKSELTVKRAFEGFIAAEFTTFMTQVVNLRVLDSFGRPEFQAWRQIVDIGSFDNFEQQQSERFENSKDYIRRRFREGVGTFRELAEKVMPSYFPSFWDNGWGINFTTTTIPQLLGIVQALQSDGRAANRTIEKFVFVTLLEDNPSITVDGSSQSLFADSHTGGEDNDAGGAVQVLDRVAFEAAAVLLADQTMDGERLDLEPGNLIVRKGSANHWRALELMKSTLHPESDSETEGSNKTNVIPTDFGVNIIATPVIDKDSVFLTADFSAAPDLAIELNFFGGNDTPQVVDIDKGSSPHYELTGTSRFLNWMAMGGTPRSFHGFVRISTAS